MAVFFGGPTGEVVRVLAGMVQSQTITPFPVKCSVYPRVCPETTWTSSDLEMVPGVLIWAKFTIDLRIPFALTKRCLFLYLDDALAKQIGWTR